MIDQWWNGFTPPEISVVEPDEGPSNWYFLFFYCILPCLKSFQLFFGATNFFVGCPSLSHTALVSLWQIRENQGRIFIRDLTSICCETNGSLSKESSHKWRPSFRNWNCEKIHTAPKDAGWSLLMDDMTFLGVSRSPCLNRRVAICHPQGHPKLKPFQNSGFWDVMNWAAPFSYAFEQFEVLQFLKFPNSALVFLFGLVSSSRGCRAENKNKKQQRFPWWGPIHWCDWSKPS